MNNSKKIRTYSKVFALLLVALLLSAGCTQSKVQGQVDTAIGGTGKM